MPCQQARSELAGRIGVFDQQIGKIRGIPFGDAGDRAGDRGNAPAERLVHRQSVRLVARRMHQRVQTRQDFGHVVSETEKGDAIVQPGVVGAGLPEIQLRAGAGHHELCVPVTPTAQRRPRLEHRVERLPSIAERADEADERPLARLAEPPSRGGALRPGDGTEPVRIDAVVDDVDARGVDADPLDDVPLRSRAVTDDEAGAADGRSFGRQISCVRPFSFRLSHLRRGSARFVGGVEVVNPVHAGKRTVAAVDDGARAAPLQTAPERLARAGEERAAEQMPPERAPHLVNGDAGQRGEIWPRSMGDEVDFPAGRGQMSRKGIVGHVHASERRQVAGDEQPGCGH
jgi:hypothetical protein